VPPGCGLSARSRPAGSAGAIGTVWGKGWANDWANGCVGGGANGARGGASPLCISDVSNASAKAAAACPAVSAAGSAAAKARPARCAGGSSGIWGSIGNTGGFSKRGVAGALQLACHCRAKLRRAAFLRLRQRAGGSDFKLGKAARTDFCGGKLAGLPIGLTLRIAACRRCIARDPGDPGGKARGAGKIIACGSPGAPAPRLRQQRCAALRQRVAAAFFVERISQSAHRLAPGHPCHHRLQAHQCKAALFLDHSAGSHRLISAA
jgi:hypothetical protein